MAGRTKRKTRRNPRELQSPIAIAINSATRLTDSERDSVMQPRNESLDALRRGASTELHWIHLATCAAVAKSIEDHGVVKGLRDYIDAADEALLRIAERAHSKSGIWQAPTCYAGELAAIDTLLEMHAFQIKQLSAGEYLSAIGLAKARYLTNSGKFSRAA